MESVLPQKWRAESRVLARSLPYEISIFVKIGEIQGKQL